MGRHIVVFRLIITAWVEIGPHSVGFRQEFVLYPGGVQPCSTAGLNAPNQIGPRATAACGKLCGLNNSLPPHGLLAIPLKNRNAYFQIWTFQRATKIQFSGYFWPAGHGLHTSALHWMTQVVRQPFVTQASNCASS